MTAASPREVLSVDSHSRMSLATFPRRNYANVSARVMQFLRFSAEKSHRPPHFNERRSSQCKFGLLALLFSIALIMPKASNDGVSSDHRASHKLDEKGILIRTLTSRH